VKKTDLKSNLNERTSLSILKIGGEVDIFSGTLKADNEKKITVGGKGRSIPLQLKYH